MDSAFIYVSGFVKFSLGLVFLIGLINVSGYQLQIVEGGGVSFVSQVYASDTDD